jgi:hypothetical protein
MGMACGSRSAYPLLEFNPNEPRFDKVKFKTQQTHLPYVIAKAYFLSSSRDPENLTRAEVALQELIVSIDGTDSNVSCPLFIVLVLISQACPDDIPISRTTVDENFRS